MNPRKQEASEQRLALWPFCVCHWEDQLTTKKDDQKSWDGLKGGRGGGSSAEENRVVESYEPRAKGLGCRNGGWPPVMHALDWVA
jgi:hypothetical protein